MSCQAWVQKSQTPYNLGWSRELGEPHAQLGRGGGDFHIYSQGTTWGTSNMIYMC